MGLKTNVDDQIVMSSMERSAYDVKLTRRAYRPLAIQNIHPSCAREDFSDAATFKSNDVRQTNEHELYIYIFIYIYTCIYIYI
jgi:hypothetical protein